MAFTGTAVQKMVTEKLVRITGLSLAAGVTGTIGLFGDSGAGVQLPDAFNPVDYSINLPPGAVVSLPDSVQVECWEAAASTAPVGSGGAAQMFYGLTAGTGNAGSSDYTATVAVDAAVPFPRSGPGTTGSGIVAGGTNQFVLPETAIYRVAWQVCFTEVNQLVLKLGATAQAHTCARSGAANQQNVNNVLVSATAGDLLSLVNPVGNAAALTVTPADGTLTHAQAPSLVISQVPTAIGAAGAADISITKATGPFRASVINNGLAATANLEIYVRFH